MCALFYINNLIFFSICLFAFSLRARVIFYALEQIGNKREIMDILCINTELRVWSMVFKSPTLCVDGQLV